MARGLPRARAATHVADVHAQVSRFHRDWTRCVGQHLGLARRLPAAAERDTRCRRALRHVVHVHDAAVAIGPETGLCRLRLRRRLTRAAALNLVLCAWFLVLGPSSSRTTGPRTKTDQALRTTDQGRRFYLAFSHGSPPRTASNINGRLPRFSKLCGVPRGTETKPLVVIRAFLPSSETLPSPPST